MEKIVMKLKAFASLTLLLFAASVVAAQNASALRIAEVGPYDSAAPGQIIELRVEGFGERFTSPPGDELKVRITQEGTTLTAAARTASPVIVREAPAGGDMSRAEMKAYQGVSFAVPRGLRAGEAEVVVTYRRQQSAPFKLNIVERPLRPLLGGVAITTISPASLPPPPQRGTPFKGPGLRFERGARKVEIHVRPLVDPEDAESAVLIRFKQGGAQFDATSRVVHQEKRTENFNGGVRFLPTRDVLEVDIPEQLSTGEAEMEVRLRAGGQTGDAAVMPVTITDAGRAYEAPEQVAPRMLAVAPRKLGAGQALMISVDHRRTLDPDPSKVVVVVEGQDGARYTLKPEMNSVVRNPDTAPDAPVLLIARTTQKVIGAAQVRVVNPARGEGEGGLTEPVAIEIVAEPLAPEVLSVAESTRDDLAQLRRMYEAQTSAGRAFPEYDPAGRYVTIRALGLDYNPRFLRVRLEQDGRSVTLSAGDFSLFSNNALIVRVPKNFGAGATRLTVENRGASGYSAPVVKTFELSARN
jgi:hypothetical protein